MWTNLHWVDGTWPGKLALAARPRGGDWLADEISSWHHAGIATVFSLLTAEEEKDLNIEAESAEVLAHGLRFLSFPIPDRQVPSSESEFALAVGKLEAELNAGRNLVLHCRQGIGRTGLVAACLLVGTGLAAEEAVARLSKARGVPVPETVEQRRWVDHYASSFAGI